jgi:hypothetical protein
MAEGEVIRYWNVLYKLVEMGFVRLSPHVDQPGGVFRRNQSRRIANEMGLDTCVDPVFGNFEIRI